MARVVRISLSIRDRILYWRHSSTTRKEETMKHLLIDLFVALATLVSFPVQADDPFYEKTLSDGRRLVIDMRALSRERFATQQLTQPRTALSSGRLATERYGPFDLYSLAFRPAKQHEFERWLPLGLDGVSVGLSLSRPRVRYFADREHRESFRFETDRNLLGDRQYWFKYELHY